MGRILDSRLAMAVRDISIGQWGLWRVGWPSRIDPPVKRGRWWLWLGPYLIGKPDETW